MVINASFFQSSFLRCGKWHLFVTHSNNSEAFAVWRQSGGDIMHARTEVNTISVKSLDVLDWIYVSYYHKMLEISFVDTYILCLYISFFKTKIVIVLKE